MSEKISWSNFSLWGNENIYVNEALNSTWVSGGKYIETFERELEDKLGLPNAFVVSNGTAALQLAFLTIGIQPGDEVIVPAFGFLAAANVLKQMNITPIFVDIDKEHWCISSEKIKPKITNKTKAIVVIHNYGVVAEINEIADLAKANNLYLIEDCSESIFSKYNEKYCGTFGDFSTFSFHATKTISTGEGGMICCKHKKLSDKLKLIRSHGLRRENKHYWHECYGNNFRLSNVLAAIGLGQLEQSLKIIKEKQRVFNKYKSNLADCTSLRFQSFPPLSSPLFWAVAISIDFNKVSKSRDEIIQLLFDKQIECRPGFYTPDQLEIYRLGVCENFPIANKLASSIIVLPSYPRLADEQINHICETLKEIIHSL